MFENLITTELTNLLEYTSEGNTNSILKRQLHLMLLQHSAQQQKKKKTNILHPSAVNKERDGVCTQQNPGRGKDCTVLFSLVQIELGDVVLCRAAQVEGKLHMCPSNVI